MINRQAVEIPQLPQSFGQAAGHTVLLVNYGGTGSVISLDNNPVRLACFFILSRLPGESCLRAVNALREIEMQQPSRVEAINWPDYSELIALRGSGEAPPVGNPEDLEGKDFVLRLEQMGKENPSPRQLAPFFQELDAVIGSNNIDRLNAIISSSRPETLSTAAIVFLLRSTSILRNQIADWNQFYNKSRDAVADRGRKPEELFQGLR